MALIYLKKGILLLKVVGYTFGLLASLTKRSIVSRPLTSSQVPASKKDGEEVGVRHVVIVGASFAGYHAARLIAASIPTDGSWKIIIVEPNSHYQFTWTLPRFCVVEGHEDKTFIPYGPYIPERAQHVVRWVHGRASTVRPGSILIQESGEEIPYEFLVIATGAGVGLQLPSRVGAVRKHDGLQLLRKMQERIKQANTLIVVGGGAAGVELAGDAKSQYPEKHIVLVHSRTAVMHRFGPELQAAALKGLHELQVEVILGERAVLDAEEAGVLTLASGRKIPYDFCVNCGGQKPSSELIRTISPTAISQSGHIRVKPTLQIDDPAFQNIYACGDVIEAGVDCPNARSAMNQAQHVADNIVLALQGREPTYLYAPAWADAGIVLTLGMKKSVSNVSDGDTELLFHKKDKDVTLMSHRVWTHMGAKPYHDSTPAEAQDHIQP